MNRLLKAGIGSIVGLGLVAGTLGAAFAADPPAANRPAVCAWGGSGVPGIGQRGFAFGYQAIEGAVSQLLGMSAADIRAQRLQGQSLVQIAQAKGVTEEQLVAAILQAHKAQLDQAVQDGRITQAQADLMYAHQQAQVRQNVNDTTVGPKGPQYGQGRGNALGQQNAFGLRGGMRWNGGR